MPLETVTSGISCVMLTVIGGGNRNVLGYKFILGNKIKMQKCKTNFLTFSFFHFNPQTFNFVILVL